MDEKWRNTNTRAVNCRYKKIARCDICQKHNINVKQFIVKKKKKIPHESYYLYMRKRFYEKKKNY